MISTHGFPDGGPLLAQQQQFRMPAGGNLTHAQAGGYHARLIEDQRISRVKIIRDLAEDAMLHIPAIAMEHKQPGGIPRTRGALGDGFRRKMVVEIGSAHASPIQPARKQVQSNRQDQAQQDRACQWEEASETFAFDPDIAGKPAEGKPGATEEP